MSQESTKKRKEIQDNVNARSPAKKTKSNTPKTTPTKSPLNTPHTTPGNTPPSSIAKNTKGLSPVAKKPESFATLIELDGKRVLNTSTTLHMLRAMYDNEQLWLVETQSQAQISDPAYVISVGKEYRMCVPRRSLEKNTKEEICKQLENIPSASTYASPNLAGCWRRNVGISKYMKVHRPDSGTPVVLLDPVLSELYDDIVCDKYNPTSRDCSAAVELMEALSRGFASEPAMQEFVPKWAARSLEWPLTRTGDADGSWIMGGSLLLNLELKNEKGTGGSSYMQSIGYFTKHWATETRKSMWKKSLCPTILVEITGPEISIFLLHSIFVLFFPLIDLEIAVSGAVLDEQGVLCDPFATASLLFNIYDYNHLVRAARILGAVTKAARKLESYYQKFDVPCDGYPLFRTIDPTEYLYETDCDEIKIEYTGKIKELLYEADLRIGESDPKKVIVKFTHSYNKEAHEVCESADCAPKLYFVGQASRFQVVIMERIENANCWHAVDDSKHKRAAKKVIEKTIAKLHEHNLVHGDLRSTNILLSGKRVAVIDFDWSGPPSQVYPLFMNHADIKWPEGVGEGKLLSFEHDDEWLNRNFV